MLAGALARAAVLAGAASASAGCALLPQTSTELNIALAITGVLIVGAVVAALVVTFRGKK